MYYNLPIVVLLGGESVMSHTANKTETWNSIAIRPVIGQFSSNYVVCSTVTNYV